jgi:hypothetical protein
LRIVRREVIREFDIDLLQTNGSHRCDPGNYGFSQRKAVHSAKPGTAEGLE